MQITGKIQEPEDQITLFQKISKKKLCKFLEKTFFGQTKARLTYTIMIEKEEYGEGKEHITVEVRFWHGHVWLPKKVGSSKLDEYCETDWTMLQSANG